MNRRFSTAISCWLLALLAAGSPALAQSPAEAKPDPPSVASLFTDIARDLRHLVMDLLRAAFERTCQRRVEAGQLRMQPVDGSVHFHLRVVRGGAQRIRNQAS